LVVFKQFAHDSYDDLLARNRHYKYLRAVVCSSVANPEDNLVVFVEEAEAIDALGVVDLNGPDLFVAGVRVFRDHMHVVSLWLIRLVFFVSAFGLVAVAHDVINQIAVAVLLVVFHTCEPYAVSIFLEHSYLSVGWELQGLGWVLISGDHNFFRHPDAVIVDCNPQF